MNCSEFDQHWQRRLDVGAGTDPAHLQAHLAECPRCQTWQRAWENLERAIDQGSPLAPVPQASPPLHTLADRVVAELQRGSSRADLPGRTGLAVNSLVPCQPPGDVNRHSLNRRGLAGRSAMAAACLAAVCLVWEMTRLPRPAATQPAGATSTERVVVSSVPAQQAALDEERHPAGPSAVWDLPGERRLGSGSSIETTDGKETVLGPPRPPIVKPLVGMVHNLTSLVLPGWPSIFNDSVGIPHYLDGETFDAAIAGRASSASLEAPLVLVEPPVVSWPEPVEELLAVASESVQTMWDLASRW